MRNLFLLAFGLFFISSTTGSANAEDFKCTSLNALVEMAAEDAIGAKIRFQASISVASPFTAILANEKVHFKVKETAVEAMQKLFCADIGDDAETILTLVKLAKAFFHSEDMKKAIERELKAVEIQEGSCGGFLFILLYGLLGMLGGCRSKLLVVLVALGCIVSTADATCTDAQIAGNEVAAQYGMVFYDCDKNEIPQSSKDAVYDVIYKGYVEQKGRLSKEYIRGRWARVESAFWSVWKDSPLWQAQIAAAICSKEFLCGVQVKYSEWESWRWVGNRTNSNGSIDCGITQINSTNTPFSCDELQDFVTAFKEQRRIIMLKVRNSASKSVWKKRIHRYNHAKNYEYGVKIWQWSGASFGWATIWFFILGLFRRRKSTYMLPVTIKRNVIIEIDKDQFILDCTMVIFTIHDPNKKGYDKEDKVVGHYFSALSPDGKRYIKNSPKGYYLLDANH